MIGNPTSGLLARELIKPRAVSRGIDSGIGEALNATLGARLLSTFPPNERFQLRVRVAGNVAMILLRVASFLSSRGRVADDTQTGRSLFPHVSGVIRCGLTQKIPTLVHVEVLTHEPGSCLLAITAAAKEGLFSQHAAQLAAEQMAKYIHASCEDSGRGQVAGGR